MRYWHGSALGARATIALAHPEGQAIARRAFAETDRLEDIFSLYRSDSALSRLNRDGVLADPPFELLECLGICGTAHRATDGLFDPTVQPLWALYAQSYSKAAPPAAARIDEALDTVGWSKVSLGATGVRLPRGGALTLNGVAQGYIADRIATLLRAEGLGRVLIDTGEINAIGGSWTANLRTPTNETAGEVTLRNRALASSAPLGTAFDRQGSVGHILDPRSGRPASANWRLVSVTAPSAAVADALSTALVLMNREQQQIAISRVADANLLAAVRSRR